MKLRECTPYLIVFVRSKRSWWSLHKL